MTRNGRIQIIRADWMNKSASVADSSGGHEDTAKHSI